MNVLVDYNNVIEIHRRRGVVFIVDKILEALREARRLPTARLDVRLYDGWYDQQTLTRRAQEVSAQAQSSFPMTRKFSDGTTTQTIVVKVELAYSLLCAPAQHLWHTFRSSIHAGDVIFRHPSTVGCADAACPLIAAHRFLQNRRCPAAGCKITPEALLHRAEQKLVDTMMATDLFAIFHQQLFREVAIVSSDDDLWPPIKLLLQLGLRVIHIHTASDRTTPAMYSRNAGTNYVQLHL